MLPAFASAFDVGLALEPSIPLNRDICLTNKVFTYLLAGNAIIYSNTKMQKHFNSITKTGVGFDVDDLEGLIECIRFYLNTENLISQREYNYNIAKYKYNWEVESKKIFEVVN